MNTLGQKPFESHPWMRIAVEKAVQAAHLNSDYSLHEEIHAIRDQIVHLNNRLRNIDIAKCHAPAETFGKKS